MSSFREHLRKQSSYIGSHKIETPKGGNLLKRIVIVGLAIVALGVATLTISQLMSSCSGKTATTSTEETKGA
jgi:hypothetical protein